MLKTFIFSIIALFFAGLCAAGLLYLHFVKWTDQPAGSEKMEKIFTIVQGQGLRQTAASLEQEGLVSDALRFRLLARLEKKDKLIQAGEYFFSSAMTPKEILGQLVEGRVHLYRVTIPEGFTLTQIAAAVAGAGLAPEIAFLQTTRNPSIAKQLGIPIRFIGVGESIEDLRPFDAADFVDALFETR